MAPKRVTIQATSHSTPKSVGTEKRNDFPNGPRNSPIMGNSRMFYQPGEKDKAIDLPEADQKPARKESLPHDRSENGATAILQVKRAPIPSYEEATRRSNAIVSTEISVKPKKDDATRTGEAVVSRKNEKVKNHEEGEKKKSSVWYEYGEV